jgi:glycosyltransferase involved in cell wall biosynthesis
MRAGLFLDALAADHDVTLLVVPVSGPPARAWPAFVRSRTEARACLDLSPAEDPGYQAAAATESSRRLAALRAYPRPVLARFGGAAAIEVARQAIGHGPFDAVHVFRLYLAPFLDAVPERPRAVLDLDDDEVETRRRLAALHGARGETALMVLEAAEADKYGALERAWLERFAHVLVCSERDRKALAARTRHSGIATIPNGVRCDEPVTARRDPLEAADQPFRLLFVGTLGYLPNVDAATTLCRDILPRLRGLGSRDVRVDLVGAHPAPSITDLARLDGVEIHADVPSVTPFYERAGAAVTPLRAGGGTRIKLLEAFARGVPVVTTSIGAEGLEVDAERHLLVAEDPDGLARACARLMRETGLAGRLRAEALRLVAARYDAVVVSEAIRRLFREGLAAV